jgi:hypothetical protein
MAGKYPIELDTDAELYEVVDNEDDVIAVHHNVLKDAIKAIQEKLGIDNSAVETTIDFLLKQQAIKSDPPSGKYKVINLFVDPSNGRLTIQYDDTPIP